MVFNIPIVDLGVVMYMYPQYMCILYVKLLWCISIPYIFCQLGRGIDVCLVYVHSPICVTYFGVMVFHRSIANWEEGIDVCSVYVHFVICETYLV